MRVLVSGDKHLGLVSDGMERLEEQSRILEACAAALWEHDPEVYVDLGDLFHSPRPGPGAYELAVDYLCRVADWAERKNRWAYFMTGNHDKPTRGGVHALRPFGPMIDAAWSNVTLIDRPTVDGTGDRSFLFLPHVTDWEARERDPDLTAEAWLETFSRKALDRIGAEVECLNGPAVVFTHLEIPGAKMSNDETVQRETGLSLPGFLLEDERVVRVYAGHVHRFQELERVTVVGSALYVDFGEAADPKGMILAEV